MEEFRSDALLARDFGFAGKWTGIPDQTAMAVEIFQTPDEEIEHAINYARQFLVAEASGRGATMIDGKMADRATDRIIRNTLKKAYAMRRLDEALASQLALEKPCS
jgi:citrate lyase subunit beta/citryl-CoA lyase